MSNSFETLWTVACLVPQSVEFSRQEYWSGLGRGDERVAEVACARKCR